MDYDLWLNSSEYPLFSLSIYYSDSIKDQIANPNNCFTYLTTIVWIINQYLPAAHIIKLQYPFLEPNIAANFQSLDKVSI